MPQHRSHFYMVCATVLYVRKDDQNPNSAQTKQKTMNIVVQAPEKKISASVLDDIKNSLTQIMAREGQVPAEDLHSIIFQNIFHLGFMSQDEFHDMETAKKKPTGQYGEH